MCERKVNGREVEERKINEGKRGRKEKEVGKV
jgi:hypothetical protein